MKPQNHLYSFQRYLSHGNWYCRNVSVTFLFLLLHGMCLAKSEVCVRNNVAEVSAFYVTAAKKFKVLTSLQDRIRNTESQELLNKNILRKNKGLIVAILSVLFAFTLLVVVLIRSKVQAKNLKIKTRHIALKLDENKRYIDRLIQEKKLTALNLEIKDKELATNSMSLLQNKEHYHALVNNLNMLKAYVKDTDGSRLLDEIISGCKTSDLSFNWSSFITTFENVHEHFYNNLLEKHPDLTQNEKKICAFLKLGFNTKEISAITMQSNRSIVVARSRLRTKLNLDSKENLTSYIGSF